MKRIESTQNALVKHWKKLMTARKERDKTGEFLVEGFHLVEEVLKHKNQLIQIIIKEGVAIPTEWSLENVMIVQVSEAVAKEIAETEHSQGIFAHCKKLNNHNEMFKHWKKLLLVDAVQDPGNLGTMIRTADAAGIDAIVLGKGSADPYNPKTLRSAQGSHFHLPILHENLMNLIDKLQTHGFTVYGTSLEKAKDYTEVEKPEAFALIVGNEGSGIQAELLNKTDQNIVIPIFGQAESLNVAVATGILLYHFV